MRISLLLMLGVLASLAAAMIMLPATIAMNAFVAQLTLPEGLQFRNVRGTIWQGEMDIYFRQLPKVDLHWEASISLTELLVEVEAETENKASILRGLFSANNKSVSAKEVSLSLSSRDVNQFANAYGHEIGGSLSASDVTVQLSNACLSEGSGDILWSGGNLKLKDDSGSFDARFSTPELRGVISAKDCGFSTSFASPTDSSAKIDLSIGPQGWFKAEISPQLALLVDSQYGKGRGSITFETQLR
jgi:hypothetical protein